MLVETLNPAQSNPIRLLAVHCTGLVLWGRRFSEFVEADRAPDFDGVHCCQFSRETRPIIVLIQHYVT